MALPFPTPGSLAPAFALTPITTTADAERLARVYFDAFATEPLNTYWWPADPVPMMDWMIARISRKIKNPAVRHFQVTHVASGDLVAFARWDVPKGSTGFGECLGRDDDAVDVSALVGEPARQQPAAETAASVATTTPVAEGAYADIEIPPGADEELCRGFFDALGRASEKWMKDDMLGLSLVATSPKYFRQGAAKALILPMLGIADREGRKTYLEATPAGRPVYESMGFRTVDTLEWNLDKLTADKHGLYRISIMIRDPVETK